MNLVLEENFAGVWERTIQPGERSLTPDAARYFLTLEFTGADRSRMNLKTAVGPTKHTKHTKKE